MAASSASPAEFDRFVAAQSMERDDVIGMRVRVVIGLDFGTSSTKLVARFPDDPGEPAFVVPAPAHCLGEKNPNLWKTILWLEGNGRFAAYPQPGARAISSLKVDIARQPERSALSQNKGEEPDVRPIEAATAYIAFVIRYARGRLRAENPSMFRGRRPIWIVNLGIPAANYDNEPLFRVYRKAAAGGLMLANSGKSISVETVREALQNEAVKKAAASRIGAEELGVAVFPETAAAATAFAKSPERASGLYVMIDVGAMTLDCCAFMMTGDGHGGDKFSLLEADVQPLGVDAFRWRRKRGESEEYLLEEARRCLLNLIWDTKCNRAPKESCWREGESLPVFLAGGGANDERHRRVVESLGPWLEEHARNSGIRLMDLPSPTLAGSQGLSADFSRLAVAFGLSYPPDQIGEIEPPSEIEDIPRWVASKDIEDRYVSKDQV